MHNQQQNQIIRRPRVLADIGLSNSALDREIRAGNFPPPVKLSPDPKSRAVGWSSLAVQAWISERIACAADQRGSAPSMEGEK